MDEHTRPDPPPAPPEGPEAARADGAAPRRQRRRVPLRVLAVLTAIAAGLFVSFFRIDLGPALRERAERAGSDYLRRPMHIGRLSATLTPGVFVVEDLVIEGLEPRHRPFLTAERITVKFPWWTIFGRRDDRKRDLQVESVTMSGWAMVIEQFAASPQDPNGRTNFPRFVPERRARREPGAFRRWFGEVATTVQTVRATRGHVTYEDHGVPWSLVAPNMEVAMHRGQTEYRGTTSFANATIDIQNYEPFNAEMRGRFRLDGGDLRFDRIDLISDGARSVVEGEIDIANWPEQLYRIRSEIDIATQKEIYFHRQDFRATGTAAFQGTFHLFKGGRELKGHFTSPLVGVNDWRFPNLAGDVVWVPERMHVTNATSGLYGGRARFDYLLAPLNRRGVPTDARWDLQYEDVDLAQVTDLLETAGLRLAGRASGRNLLSWSLGNWAGKRGEGEIAVRAPAGAATMTRELQAEAVARETALPPEAGPFNPDRPLGYVPMAGRIAYRLDPEWITLGRSWAATPKTYVEFEGRTAWGVRSRIPFHVTSLDWQESDRVLAGIMTMFGSPTGAVPIGGHGEFDGVMLNAFSRPRIEGTFTGDAMHAWNVRWGAGTARVAIENGYAHVAESRIVSGDSEITAAGRFSLGYPRRDGGEEIDAIVRISKRPLADLRRAFQLDDYPVDGLVSGEYHLTGRYETPLGYGRLVIEEGVAYGETFESATTPLRFEITGVRLDSLDIRKGRGRITGAAWVAWDGNYSFTADASGIPVESLRTLSFPRAPLSGVLQFNATGTGTFEVPRYDVKLRVDDLFAGDEGIGTVIGRLGLRGELLTAEFDAASPRLQVSGSGRIALTPEMDAEMTLRFAETSLDPYVRFFEPRLSPFTTAVAGGTVRVAGELMHLEHLIVETQVEQLDMKLFDYPVSNRDAASGTYRPIELRLQRNRLEVGQFSLFGEGTRLAVTGAIDFGSSTLGVTASGDANLGILQGFFRDIRSSGSATLKAEVEGSLKQPVFAGSAQLREGRIRHFALPHSLEAINGTANFDAEGIRVDGITARLAEGRVQFGGRIGLDGFAPGDINLTAVGEDIRLRYPEGFRSRVNTDLQLTGGMEALDLTGTVTVLDASYTRRFEVNPDFFSRSDALAIPGGAAAAPAQTLPVSFDVRIVAPQGSLRVENNIARLSSSAELRLTGTLDRPQLFGQAEIDRGDLIFEGNRYVVNRGTIAFSNPARIEPFFDLEAETRIRLPGQTYVITVNVTGAFGDGTAPIVTFNSDPPLSTVDIFSLILGETSAVESGAFELRSLSAGRSAESEEELLKLLGARLLGGQLTGPLVRRVEQTLGFDTVQITPFFSGSVGDVLTPSARLIIGKRLSNRAYVTFARALGGNVVRDQSIVLEYDQSDRLGWVLTQTGDHTFAVDFRVRRSF